MSLESRYYYEEGIILFKKKIGEGDLLLTIYGKEKGKFFAIAKGALKIKNRLRGKVSIFSVGRGYFVRRREVDLLISWESYEKFLEILEDVDKFILISDYIRRADKFIPLEVKDLVIYSYFYNFLKSWRLIDKYLGDVFLIKLLQRLGYMGKLELKCKKCIKDLSKNDYMYFNLRDNVVYCEECKDIGSVKVDLREVMEFNEILDKTFDEIVREKYINSFDNLNLIGRMIERIEQEV
ncbi:MAG: DNA repair protein RecO [Dictyoglomus thermophilum]|uniref:DNA repair protein RecO n=1 Tax=Dictyoglomus thermophilum TaxID=14 RepID=A0A7C2CRH5_DICTH|nr:DNA repair protein RecO [Dictyoglomus thermophilum]MCX7719709.1 DNA repair protein RecO [Dictyoglomus thermophilum]TYT21143.1 DNA repair protein RecO [Dictyoglomus thermophilum]